MAAPSKDAAKIALVKRLLANAIKSIGEEHDKAIETYEIEMFERWVDKPKSDAVG